MRFNWKIATLLSGLMLSACTSIPVSSLLTLSRVDFATTRIQDLRVAVEIPSEIRPREGGVQLDVIATLGTKEDKYSFKLENEQPQIGMKGLLPFPAQGKRIYAYRLSDADTVTLIKLRKQRLDERKDGDQGSLSISVGAKEFCRMTSLDAVPLTISTYIATSETKGFVELIRNFDLREGSETANTIATMPLCKNRK